MVLVFDLNGTLTDPSGIGEPWGLPKLGYTVLSGAIQLALADTVLGDFHEFAVHIESSLRAEVACQDLDDERIEAALERAKALDPYPDVPDALADLAESGHRLAVLTNSGADAGRATLEAAGLADWFEAILGVDAVHVFKPHPKTYAHALAALGAQPAETMMVAAHAWDIAGAGHAGMRAAFVSRSEAPYPAVQRTPDVSTASLSELATSLRPAPDLA